MLIASLHRVPEARSSGRSISRVAPWLALVCTLASGPASGTEIPFTAKSPLNLTAQDGATSIAFGDLDLDGDLDAVAASAIGTTVGWLENTAGDGSTWAEHLIEGSFIGAAQAISVDLDGDGDLDVLAAAAVDGDVKWWENDGTPADDLGGDGNSWTEHSVALSFDGARSVAVVDLDGDGDLDLLGAAAMAGDVVWWENDGTPTDNTTDLGSGNFWTLHPIDTALLGAAAVSVADVDGDGDVDVLAAAADDDDIVWWENDGTPVDNTTDDGSGNFWTEHPVATAFDGAIAVAAADLDDDGDLDVLAAAKVGNDLHWWESDGTPADGGWTEHVLDTDLGGASGVAAHDLDSDGDVDVIATGDVDDNVVWWENDGTPADGGWTERSIDALFDGALSPAVGDLDGDGDLDLGAAAFDGDEVAWWKNQTIHRSAVFPAEHTIDGAFDQPGPIALADVDSDGAIDVLATGFGATTEVDMSWWKNNGDGMSWTETIITDALGSFDGPPTTFSSADIDGDGDLDVVGGSFGVFAPDVVYWENNGSGTSWTEREVEPSFTPSEVSVGDLDDDGDIDIVGTGGASNVVWWENDGTPANGSWTRREIDASMSNPEQLVVVDVDRDGDLDVVAAARTDGDIAWFESDGSPLDGGWTRHTIEDAMISPTFVAVADLDSDGDPDVLAGDMNGHQLLWWGSDGSPADETGGDGNSWTEHVLDFVNDFGFFQYGLHGIATGDLDSDGDQDILTTSLIADRVHWFENTAGDASTWVLGTAGSTFTDPEDVATGDLDGDGRPDVAAASLANDRLAWWNNQGGQFTFTGFGFNDPEVEEGQPYGGALRIDFLHRGRSGDSAVELATLEVLFEESAGDVLTTAEANNLFEGLEVTLDDGDGFPDGGDTFITSIDTLSLVAGVQTIVIPDGNPNAQVAFLDGSQRYHVSLDILNGASSAVPNTFRLTHLVESTSTAEDASADVTLDLEAATNVSTVDVTVTPVCRQLKPEHTGSGTDPAASPVQSAGCAQSFFFAGEPITLTATPDPGHGVGCWEGTDADASTGTGNSATMPLAPFLTVKVHYFALDLVIDTATYSSTATEQALTSITATNIAVDSGVGLTLRAGGSVVLGEGVVIEGDLTVETALPVCPSP